MRINDYSCKFFTNNEALAKFLSDVRRYTVPTVEEEETLITDFKNGNIEAGKELVCRNLRFIYSLAKIYARDENEVVDYVNEGVFGFMTALKEFDLNRGYKFITYAVWYVRRSMNFYLTDTRNIVNRSNNIKIGRKIDIIKQKEMAKNGREPSVDEIKNILKEEYNIDIKVDSDLYDVNVESINEEIDDDYTVENSSEYAEKTATVNDYESVSEQEYKKAMVRAVLSMIPEKYADVMKMLYGIDYERSYTAEEVGEKYHMRAMEVVKMRDKAIKYIQQNSAKIKSMAI